MLYEQIRYAEVVRKLYRLRHLLTQKDHPDIASRLGYSKYSKQFYRIKRKLREEEVLDKQGRFVENLPNLWIVELPLHASKEQISTLGNEVSYNVFLATSMDSPRKAGQLSEELNFNRMAIYNSIDKLRKARLVTKENSKIYVNNEAGVYSWLVRYIELCKTYTDTTNDTAVLFKTVPAYIDGPQAYYMINYEPGRPVGPADMIIRTYEPYKKFWQSVLGDVRYFKEYPKKVEIAQARATDKVVLLEGVPYNKKAKLELEA
jgi:predicted transcriptional regulator